MLIAFLFGFTIRLIPELLSSPNPIGWDTVYYASRIKSGTIFTVGSDLVNSWLIYGILITLANLTRLDPFLILKILGPILYGGTCAGMFFVAQKRLNWSSPKSLLVAVLFSFQLATLAISWQFYRNVLGIMVLLFALPLIRSDVSYKGTVALSILSLFTIWAHELAMVSLFFIVFVVMMQSVLKKEKIPFRVFMAVLPAALLFMGNFFWISPFAIPINANLVRVDDSVWAHPGGLFFLTDYLNVYTPIESYTSYGNLFFDVTSLFIILYALVLPLVTIGYFKDKVLTSWTILLLLGGLGCLIVPSFALFLWARWMLLLIFPFTIYATNGLWKITKNLPGNRLLNYFKKFKITRKIAIGLALISMMIGGLFMVYPLLDGKYGLINWGGTFKYFPSTMQTSSIPLGDVEGVTRAFGWLNNNMETDSTLLVHDAFDNWAIMYLNQNHTAYLFDFNITIAKNQALNDGYQTAYFIWWNQNINWYNLTVPKNWIPIQNYGRISVYKTT